MAEREFTAAMVLSALTPDWQRTQDVARKLDCEWTAGGHQLRPVRDMLYALHTFAPEYVEHQPRRNGHLWRLRGAATGRGPGAVTYLPSAALKGELDCRL